MHDIELENISIGRNGNAILRQVDFAVERGTTSVVMGPSGAGKSSILRVILGLWVPEEGTVRVAGTDITALSEKRKVPIRRKMGMVFQSNALFDSMTVADNLSFLLKKQQTLDDREIRLRIEESLSIVNMAGTEDKFPSELSGGMKKRAAIARAIAFRPEILLYDEPTTGLDPFNVALVCDLILRLQRQGTTSVIVTHDLRNAFAVGDHFSIIINGAIAVTGPAQKILASNDQAVKDFLSEIDLYHPTSQLDLGHKP